MKRGTLALLVLFLLLGIGAAGAFIFHGGLSARATPSALEASIARSVRHLAIPSAARAAANPVPSSPEFLREARLHFADHCAFCHANDGSGAAAIIGSGLYPKPPDLRLPRTQNLSDGELFWIIENGIRFTGMPAFASHGEEAGSWKLVHFIRHLPQLTPEERAEMERYNPKGPEEREEEQQEQDFLNGALPQPAQQPSHHH